MKNNDIICFGCNVPRNELKYFFHLKSGKASLEKNSESDLKIIQPVVSPINELSARKKLKFDSGESNVHSPSANFCTSSSKGKSSPQKSSSNATLPLPTLSLAPVLSQEAVPAVRSFPEEGDRPPLSNTTDMPQASVSLASYPSSVELDDDDILSQVDVDQTILWSNNAPLSVPEVSSTMTVVVSPQVISVPASSSKETTSLLTINALPPCQAKSDILTSTVGSACASLGSSGVMPSSISLAASTNSIEDDDLFDIIISKSCEILASFDTTDPVLVKDCKDGTTIHLMAQKSEEEKHKLLSSIKALKSELAAKNEWITKREQDEKKSAEEEGIVSSMTEEFTCVICQELFIKAHTLPCSHSFCEHCIKEWLKTRSVCPICREHVISGPVHSLVLDNAITKIEEKLSAEKKQDREAAKEEHKKKKCSVLPSVAASSSADTSLEDSLYENTSDEFNSEDEFEDGDSFDELHVDHFYAMYDWMLEEPHEDVEAWSDDGYEGTYYSGGYGGYGRCYHCGK